MLNTKPLVIQLLIECSKGTYVRSLITDLAKQLDSVAMMSALQRTVSSGYTIDNTTLSLKTALDLDKSDIKLITNEQIATKVGSISLDSSQVIKFGHGVKQCIDSANIDKIIVVDNDKQVIGIGRILEKTLIPVKVFYNG